MALIVILRRQAMRPRRSASFSKRRQQKGLSRRDPQDLRELTGIAIRFDELTMASAKQVCSA